MEAVREELVTFEPFSDLDELTLQDRMAAIDEPSSRQVLAASHHILAAVFTRCFDPISRTSALPSRRMLGLPVTGAKPRPMPGQLGDKRLHIRLRLA